VAEWLAAQFHADWRGESAYVRADFGPELAIASFDGVSNVGRSRELLDLFEGAQRSIEVLSAYPTMPFTVAMARAAARGVPVTIHTPRPNNKPVVRDYLLGFAPQAGIRLNMIDAMTHVKAALIDGETLLMGSSNFDFVSYRLNSEYVAILRDTALIAEAVARLFAPAREAGSPPRDDELGGLAPPRARLALEAADRALRFLKPGPRIAEWRRPR
jgi:cardiolipin synthase